MKCRLEEKMSQFTWVGILGCQCKHIQSSPILRQNLHFEFLFIYGYTECLQSCLWVQVHRNSLRQCYQPRAVPCYTYVGTSDVHPLFSCSSVCM